MSHLVLVIIVIAIIEISQEIESCWFNNANRFYIFWKDNMDFLQLMINAEAEDEIKKETNGEVKSSEDGWNKSKG